MNKVKVVIFKYSLYSIHCIVDDELNEIASRESYYKQSDFRTLIGQYLISKNLSHISPYQFFKVCSNSGFMLFLLKMGTNIKQLEIIYEE